MKLRLLLIALATGAVLGAGCELGEWECAGHRVSFLDGRFVADVLEEDGRLVLDRDGTRYLEQ